jgi:hypothetical protein
MADHGASKGGIPKDFIESIMAKHPPPKGSIPKNFPAPRIYRVIGTGLGATMWFFVSLPTPRALVAVLTVDTVVLPDEERWYFCPLP